MALKDYHLAGESGTDGGNVGGATWIAQTFVPLSSYTATSLAVRVWRAAGTTGTITVSLRAISGGLPTGSDLASGTLDITTLDTSSPGQFHTITLSAGVALTAGTRYAIVLRRDTTAGNIYFRVSGGTVYAFGQRADSVNSGSTWALPGSPNTTDLVFKVSDNSTFTPQLIIAGGSTDAAKQIYKIKDDGETLTLLSSHQSASTNDVNAMAYSAATDRLYTVENNNFLYCYNVSDMSLVTSWGTSGSINLGAIINDIAVDANDNLAVAHNQIGTRQAVSLYNSSGTLVWSPQFTVAQIGSCVGAKVSFNVNGNVDFTFSGTGGASVIIAAQLNVSTGAIVVTFESRTGSGQSANALDSHKETGGQVFFTRLSAATTTLRLSDSTPTWIWSKSISGTAPNELAHVGGLDFLVVANNTALIGYNDSDGGTHAWGDYNPTTSTPLSSPATIYEISVNTGNNEFYFCDGNGVVAACNIAFSARSTIDVSATTLNAVVWTGNYSSPITATISGTGSISTATLTYGAWRRILTEYMPTYEGNIKNFTINDLTASRLVASDANKKLSSVSGLSSWISGTANQVIVADDGDGTITLSTPQDIHTGASPTFAGLTLTGKTGILWANAGVVTGDATLDQIGNLAANKTFNNAAFSISFNFTNPTNQPTYDGAFEIQASGAFTGDLLHVHQHTGNPGAGTHLVKLDAEDSDVHLMHMEHNSASAIALHFNVADVEQGKILANAHAFLKGIDSAGNIIIDGSTDTPYNPATYSEGLRVNRASNNYVGIHIGGAAGTTAGTASGEWTINRTGDGHSDPGCFRIYQNTNNGNGITIGTDGQVGIGTEAPTTAFEVNGVITATSGNSTNWNTAYTHSQIAGGDSVHVSVTENSNWDAAYAHVSSTGDDHTWINQDVTTAASPTFVTMLLGNTGDTYIILRNPDSTDADGGRIDRIYAQGKTAAGVIHTLGTLRFSHFGAGADQSGRCDISLNSGSGTLEDNFSFRYRNFYIRESSSAQSDEAALGQMWIKDTTPNQLWFDDDAGGSYQVSPNPSVNSIMLLEKSSDPAQPGEGTAVIWLSDGTGYGDDGDVCIAGTAGGTTKKAIIFDHSAGDAW